MTNIGGKPCHELMQHVYGYECGLSEIAGILQRVYGYESKVVSQQGSFFLKLLNICLMFSLNSSR